MIRRLPSFFSRSPETTTKQDDGDARPPPPYSPSPKSPFLLTETRTTRTHVITTTTETTTETTRHVLPVRGDYEAYSTPPTPDMKPESMSGAGSSGFLSLDKALPPTPPHSASPLSESPRTSISSRRSAHLPQNSSVSQLGRTSLAISLPPAAGSDLLARPAVSAGTSVSFPLLPPPTNKQAAHHLRRPKSANRVQHESPTSPVGDDPRRRSRGLSLGTVSWLGLGTSQDTKGKGKEKENATEMSSSHTPTGSPKVPSKPLSRKPSFWSRKKNAKDPLHQPNENRANETTPRRQPPTLPPLNIAPGIEIYDVSQPSPHASPSRRSPLRPSLGRRHSDNPSSTPINSDFDQPVASSSRTPDNAISASPHKVAPSLSHDPNLENIGCSSPSPRPRAQTNPPLLHRLSSALFPFSEPPSSHASPKHSMSSCASPVVAMRDVPKPSEETESPSLYVSRLRSVVSKAEIAVVLASSSEPFYVEALNCFFRRFDFHDEPLDIALRKLLMEVGLPRETQQIDRVMEAFSSRYSECNPTLFADKDHGYVLAFSLIMLHTDAFNPSNRSKMSKADYIRNTSLAGLPGEVLGCYYDNIVFAPFIFIEDPMDFNGQAGLSPELLSRNSRSPATAYNGGVLGKTKIDPYYLITHDLLESMQEAVEQCVPLDEPFTWSAIGHRAWSEGDLQAAFSNASVIEVQSPNSQPTPALANGTPQSMDAASPHSSIPTSTTIRVSKVGVLNRKDDVGPRGRRNAFRKWRSWSVLLTGSQLLFYRDPSFAGLVLRAIEAGMAEDEGILEYTSRAGFIKPDEILSVKGALAVYDRAYTKRDHTVRFVLADGRQLLLQASSTEDMDEWLTKVNYASAFKSAGVRIRPLGMSQDEVHMTGVAAATALLHDTQPIASPTSTPLEAWDISHSRELMGMLSGDSFTHRPSLSHRRLTIAACDDFDVDSLSFVDMVASQQFETTFKRVKADLAHNNPDAQRGIDTIESPPVTPMTASSTAPPRPPTRSGIVRGKIAELQAKLAATQLELETNLRLVRNIAILKPFQRATRARLLQPVQSVAQKTMLLRLEVARFKCHLSVLQQDLESEHRSLDEMQSVAFEIAKQSLDRGSHQIPRMTLSRHDHDDHATSKTSPKSFARSWSNSSMAESFRSALEYPSEEIELDTTSTSLAPSQIFDHPDSTLSPSISPHPAPRGSTTSLPQRSASFSSSPGLPHNATTCGPTEPAEEAEAWNKTRCAQRVSLIRVPSTLSFAHPASDGRN